MLVFLFKRCYKYQHKKVNKKYFFVLTFNYFRFKLRGKGVFLAKNMRNLLILNGFKVFYTNSVDSLQFFNNSIGIALSY